MVRDFNTTRKLFLREFQFEFNQLNLDLKINEVNVSRQFINSIIKENYFERIAYITVIKILTNNKLTKDQLKCYITNFKNYLNNPIITSPSLLKTIELLQEVFDDNINCIVLKEFNEDVKSTCLINTMEILDDFIEQIEIHRIFEYISSTEISSVEVKEAINSTEIKDVLEKIKEFMFIVNNYEYFDYDLVVYELKHPKENGEEIAIFTYDNINDDTKHESAYLYHTTNALRDAFMYMGIIKVLQQSYNERKDDLLKKFQEEKASLNYFASNEIEKLSKLRGLYSSKNVIIFVYLANALNLTKEQALSLSRKLKLNNGKSFKTKFDDFQNILFPNNKYLK